MALGVAVLVTLAIAVPTAMIQTPVFGRAIAVTWWAWPSLLVTAALSGVLASTYVTDPGGRGSAPAQGGTPTPSRQGFAAGLLTTFAVGCPVCNKLVLLALGTTGAVQWFAPVQPVLQLAAIGLLGWAIRARVLGARACPTGPLDRLPRDRPQASPR